MKKLRFADGTELEVEEVSQAGETLKIQVNTADVNALTAVFKKEAATGVMRYFVGTDLLRGYAGFTRLIDIKYVPDVVKTIDYSITDVTTESGFAEEKCDVCMITMKKAPLIAGLANQTEQNTANIDYLAMETGIDL